MKLLKYGAALLITMALWGCGKGNSAAPVTIDPVTKKHSVGWVTLDASGIPTHASDVNGYYAKPDSCAECHGQDLAGGISGVSCSTTDRNGVACHAKFPHVNNFADFDKHGVSAKNPVGGKDGMAHCQKCHGGDYLGRSTAKSCIGCHKSLNALTNAPHAANWLSGSNVNGLRHSSTHKSNAAACFVCHKGGLNNKPTGGSLRPAPPAPLAGAAPDCYNNTMCHDSNVGHSAGWTVSGGPGIHGGIAKSSLSFCQTCHALPATGNNPRFTGGTTFTSCESCHNRPFIAHPQTWVPGRGITSGAANTVSTHGYDTVAYADCKLCHGAVGNATAPSCISVKGVDGLTGCHASAPVTAAVTPATNGCVSCHSEPPATDAHAVHMGLASNITCDACHYGAGKRTSKHANGTKDVVISPLYQAKTGDPAINGGNGFYNVATKRCNNVSCHGAKTTAPWDVTAVITQNCNFCHNITGNDNQAGDVDPGTLLANDFATPPLDQYNNAFSGVRPAAAAHNLHFYHAVTVNQSCLNCHFLMPNSQHFSDLSTPVMNTANIVDGTKWSGSYSATGNKTCTNVSCHSSVAATIDWLR